MLGNTKSPVLLVTTGADSVRLVSLINVTVAPGTTAPCVSLTVPDRVAVTPCAATDPWNAISSRQSPTATRTWLLTPSRKDIAAPPLVDGDYRHDMLRCQYMCA